MSKQNATVIETLLHGDREDSSSSSDRPRPQPKQLLNDPRFQIRPMQQIASACTGAMITACLMTPLDVIKTRMQTQQSQSKCFLYCNGLMDHLFRCGAHAQHIIPGTLKPHFRSTLDALIKISRHEGIGALWSGLGPTLVSALPSTVIYFVAYDRFKVRYVSLYYQHFASESQQSKLPLLVPMLSGVTARIFAVTLVSPIELVRTKMQSERLSYAQVRSFLSRVMAQEGLAGLWRGLPPTILRDVPFSGIYWPVYEYLKYSLSKSTDEYPSFTLSFVAGVLAGSLAALVTCPFDVVKTHEQIEFGERVIFTDTPSKELNKQSTYRRLVNIQRTYGWRGLFAGYGPRLFKVAPACAIMISTFEYSKQYFFYYNIQQHNNQLLLNNPNAQLVNWQDVKK